MADTIVIKVKLNKTLRRFSLAASPTPTLVNLEKKIHDLFKLSDGATVTMTYVDDEQDAVTMASDEDVYDAVVLQKLNPLRMEISVEEEKVKVEEVEKDDAPVLVNAEDMLSVGSDGVSIEKIPAENADAASAPVAASATTSPDVLTSYASSTSTNDSHEDEKESPVLNKVTEMEDSSTDDKSGEAKFEALPVFVKEEVKEKSDECSDFGTVSEKLDNEAPVEYQKPSIEAVEALVMSHLKAAFEKAGDHEAAMKEFKTLLEIAPAKIAEVLEAATKSGLSVSFEPIFESNSTSGRTGEERAPEKSTSSSPDPAAPKALGELDPASDASAAAAASQPAAPECFHPGIQCDVCGMCPIMGPRFKSMVKFDYDLCNGCFTRSGSPSQEYNRIDRPIVRPRHQPFWGPPPHCRPGGRHLHFGGRPFYTGRQAGGSRGGYDRSASCNAAAGAGASSHGCGGAAMGAGLASASFVDGRLDARFVRDISIFDGTELMPETKFTKIWRLRNNGTVPWPAGTQLVHVGGDKLGACDAVPVLMPEGGAVPEQEVDVAVDLEAPLLPGRYVSHWRLLAPQGPKFGHRVWALIQVVSKDEPSPQVAVSAAAAEAEQKPQAPSEDLSSSSVVQSSNEASAPSAPAAAAVGDKEADHGVHGSASPVAAAETSSAVDGAAADAQLNDVAENGVDNEAVYTIAGSTPAVSPAASASGSYMNQSESFTQSAVFVDVPSSLKEEHDSALSVAPAAPAVHSSAHGVESDALSSSSASISDASVEKSEFGGFSFVNHVSAPAEAVVPTDKPADKLHQPMDVEVTTEVEVQLLGSLEAMGFSDRKLNLELLKQHNMDMALTVDDLVAAAEWDPMLEDLAEMGFYDKEVNKRLMMKNRGSVKRTVKDLVQLYSNNKLQQQ
eukprot:TRINITY_DN31_c0_g1_i1.p1 TRINITY_DN31_c0_g1~~TRINITY_DN31_c0_g1_i1.p1  ORF type:complete len:899 (+),score=285.23 TRINITY_DN31_c0_g1_i1:102-2798(+)